jgi:hypothetical protein
VIDTAYFEIDDLKIKRGKTINEIQEFLKAYTIAEQNDEEIHYKITRAYGLEAVGIALHTVPGRPVINVDYFIDTEEKDNAYYLDALIPLFGRPEKYKEKNTIITWKFDTGAIHLHNIDRSIKGPFAFPPERKGPCGDYMIWMQFLYTDYISLAKPYRLQKELFEKNVLSCINQIELIKYTLTYDQEDIYAAAWLSTEERLAVRELLWPDIFETPASVSARLNENEIVLYHLVELQKYVISNKWNSIYLKLGETAAVLFVEYTNVPECYLKIKNLKVKDKDKKQLSLILEEIRRVVDCNVIEKEDRFY